MQTHQLVTLVEPMLSDLMAAHDVVRVVDLGCGRSYLTVLLAWCFRELWKHPAQILGVDQQAVLVAKCRRRAPLMNLDKGLRFEVAPISGLDICATWRRAFEETPGEPLVHAVLALHACDTATDEALAVGIRSVAPFIAVVPCCQAELASHWATLAAEGRAGALAPLWQSPHLRREAGATLTDALRTLLLRAHGYRVTAMEAVPSEHTPKNTLLRAVRGSPAADVVAARAEYVELKAACGGPVLALERALTGWSGASGQ